MGEEIVTNRGALVMCPRARAPPVETARREATATSSRPAHKYDNMKSVVLERRGDAIRFHPTLLELAAHYRFEPRPVAPARGNEKSHASYCAPCATCGVDSP